MATTVLADYGADVIKIEHPSKGDPVRTHGPSKEGIPLWWASLSRNKKCIAINLGMSEGAELLKKLVLNADVLVENFRPGTFERWGIGPEVLHAINPRLIIARVTGFGQFGPYSNRPGFGTLAESMSGFAAITGLADGPPTLPPFGLADGIAALATAQAIMTAIFHRNTHGAENQVIDLAIIEPIFAILGPQPIVYDQLGQIQKRSGNRSVNNAPRNTYRTKDGKWVAVSTSAQSIAERVMQLVGHPEIVDEPWFATGSMRAQHADELDGYVGGWISERLLVEVIDAFEKAEAAIAPIYDISDVFEDPQFQALDTVTTVMDPDLGPVRMQNVLYRLSDSPGEIKWTGRKIGADTKEILSFQLDLGEREIEELRQRGVIRTEEIEL